MAASSSHGLLDPSVQGIHVPYQWVYATAAARLAATGFVSTDVGKLAKQTDTFEYWILTATTPVWQAVGPTADGWIPLGQTLTYVSTDAPTYVAKVTGVDVSSIVTVGTKIKLTDAGTQYFIVTAVAFGADTTITMYGGSAGVLSSGAITLPYYSRDKAPQGFDLNPATWTTTIISDSATQSQATPTSGTWYNLGTLNGNIPIGMWRVSIQVTPLVTSNAAQTAASQYFTLSTANNSESDSGFSGSILTGQASSTCILSASLYKEKVLSLASKTQYFLNSKTAHANQASIIWDGGTVPTIVRCECAYL